MDDLPVIHLCLFGCGLVVNSAPTRQSGLVPHTLVHLSSFLFAVYVRRSPGSSSYRTKVIEIGLSLFEISYIVCRRQFQLEEKLWAVRSSGSITWDKDRDDFSMIYEVEVHRKKP